MAQVTQPLPIAQDLRQWDSEVIAKHLFLQYYHYNPLFVSSQTIRCLHGYCCLWGHKQRRGIK